MSDANALNPVGTGISQGIGAGLSEAALWGILIAAAIAGVVICERRPRRTRNRK